jgi:hypothetical protein
VVSAVFVFRSQEPDWFDKTSHAKRHAPAGGQAAGPGAAAAGGGWNDAGAAAAVVAAAVAPAVGGARGAGDSAWCVGGVLILCVRGWASTRASERARMIDGTSRNGQAIHASRFTHLLAEAPLR